MKIFYTRADLSEYIIQQKTSGKLLGLVATMGALHEGHLSLIESARGQTDFVVCSIFVNPTQFNDTRDLEKYPRPIENDIKKLEASKCDALFLPEVSEMYDSNEKWHIDLDDLDKRLEGEIRPGHYQGVTQIVKKLFDTIKPDYAFFGQKDYQQFLVIYKMLKKLRSKVKLVMCPIVREKDGLAMSSRNIHLSADDRQKALALNQALNQAKADFPFKSVKQIEHDAIQFLNSSPGVQLDYFEICSGKTLKRAFSKNASSLIALVAAHVGNTRLIDNIILR